MQYLQVSTVYDGSGHRTDKSAANSTAMEVDALTRKGKAGKGKDGKGKPGKDGKNKD